MAATELFEVTDLPNRIAKRRGKRLNKATVYRWIKNGISGVRLECVWSAGALCTSLDAYQRFEASVNEAKALRRLNRDTDEINQLCEEEALAKGGW